LGDEIDVIVVSKRAQARKAINSMQANQTKKQNYDNDYRSSYAQ